ncbi:hypothetical protein C7212DRAFT_296844, partial [Tuber magnatum]
MGRQLQKKKNRSSIPKKSKHKNPRIFKVRPTGNALIAANWFWCRDRKQTLSQNYRRLGLVSRLGKATGGVEKVLPASSSAAQQKGRGEGGKERAKKLAPGEARIIRDEEGRVTQVIYGKSAEEALDSDSDEAGQEEEFMGCAGGGGEMDIVKKLEAQAAVGERKNKKNLCPGEMDWISRLVEKYGEEDYEGMVRDRKMNVYQQTLGDIRRRVAIWR